mgnify:CR=1 FL=1
MMLRKSHYRHTLYNVSRWTDGELSTFQLIRCDRWGTGTSDLNILLIFPLLTYTLIAYIIKTVKQFPMYDKNDLRELTSEIFYTKRDIRPNDEVVRYYCENGYGLSVACHEHSYGGKDGLYEIALLKGDKLHYDDHEWQDVRGYLTKAEVWNWLKIVSEY